MKGTVLWFLAGMVLAGALSLAVSDRGVQHLRFHLGLYDREAAEKDIEETLRLFNKHFASFFSTGGSLQGLNEFPAANMVKRRVFQEVNEWMKKNQLIVYDRDVFELEDVTFPDSESSVAVAKEVWFLSVQQRDTRKRLSGVKANPIRARYLLKKSEGQWQVVEYEVFREKDDVPEMRMERF